MFSLGDEGSVKLTLSQSLINRDDLQPSSTRRSSLVELCRNPLLTGITFNGKDKSRQREEGRSGRNPLLTGITFNPSLKNSINQRLRSSKSAIRTLVSKFYRNIKEFKLNRMALRLEPISTLFGCQGATGALTSPYCLTVI